MTDGGGGLLVLAGALTILPGIVVAIVGSSRRKRADTLLNKYQSDIQPTDPNHERKMATTLRMGHPRAQVFNYGFRF